MEQVLSFSSRILGNTRPVWMRPPEEPRSATALVIFLDGEIYRDAVWAPAIVEAMRRAGHLPDAWFVYLSMGNVEARWRECPCHPPFAEAFADEFLPWLAAALPGSTAAVRRVLVGLSYSGLAAAFVAHARPGIVHRVISQSGSFWWNEGWLINAWRQRTDPGATEFYLDVGDGETRENVAHREDVFQRMSQVAAVRALRDVLQAQGTPVRYQEFPGGHTAEGWRSTLPHALIWALS
jgi:enterochelin esterase family protein